MNGIESERGGPLLVHRRALLGAAAVALAVPGAARARRGDGLAPIAQPVKPGPRAFMARAEAMRALALRTGDQGYGAVVVRNGVIVGQAPSRVVVNRDPTAHAEMEAIRDAARRLGRADLSGCVMFGTSRACAMCETAAHWGNLDALYYGAAVARGGRPRYRRC